MYEGPDPQDPNTEREDVPFPTQHGPPRFAPAAQQAAPQRAGNPANQHGQPYAGNGHGVAYDLPAFMQSQQGGTPAGIPAQQVQPQGYPQGNAVQADDLVSRMRMLHVGFHIGSLAVAEIWAHHIQMFRAEYHSKTGQYITDREAFEIVTTPLLMAFSD